jgi:hypothetical protein
MMTTGGLAARADGDRSLFLLARFRMAPAALH